ncbi:DHA2 family efflux MFS transporter permease subunit [Dyella sp. M7H15-1]|uniref:DHA2 family efflux MFS transporter permease subunit n=1 Tax=Dyella sp. M7H15-1 TaxID=2501295 RepID=UPI001F0C1D4E|nr:DHA2 family efflux MFS transporter permease subunit [Dyella sp. M7H15-1]
MDFTIVNTVIPAIQADLHASVEQSQWIISIFLMALCASMVVAGRLADLHGRRLLLYLGMAIFGLSSLGAGLAGSIEWLIPFRFIQGVSCAALYTASAAIVSNAFPEGERGRAIGILFGVNGIGLAIGPVVGGMLVSGFGWRSVFLVNIPLILLSFAICLRGVHESRSSDESEKVDWLGLVLLVISVSGLMLGITQGIKWGWTSSQTLSVFGVAVILLVIFVRVERVKPSPLIHVDLFFNRGFIVASIATFSLAFFYCAAFFLMPMYLKMIGHLDGFMIGTLLLPTTAVMALASPVVGRITDHIGPRPLLMAGFLLLALSAALQARFENSLSFAYIITAFAAMGLGWACILGPSTVAALASVPERLGGVAMGASWTLHNLGGAVGLSIATIIYQVFARNWLVHAVHARVPLSPDTAGAIVADPLSAAARLSTSGMSPEAVEQVVGQFFVHGYQASMWMLLAICLLASGTIGLCIRARSRT